MPNTVEHAMGKIIALSLSGFLIAVDMLITSVAIAPMSRDLHVSISTVQWFMSGYGIGVAFFLVPAGKIADIIGHRRMNVIGLLIFWFASAGIALSQHSITVIIASIIEGMGGAAILVSRITLILQNFPEEKRGSVMGFVVGTSGFEMACGPIVGGLLIHYFNWHVAFAVNIPISAITIFLVLHYFSKSAVHSENNKVDIPSFCLLTLTLILLIVGISRGHYWHWGNSKTIICFIIAALSTLVSFPQLAVALAGTHHLQLSTFNSTQIATVHQAMDLALSYGVRICMITLVAINIVALLITMLSLHKTVPANTNKG